MFRFGTSDDEFVNAWLRSEYFGRPSCDMVILVVVQTLVMYECNVLPAPSVLQGCVWHMLAMLISVGLPHARCAVLLAHLEPAASDARRHSLPQLTTMCAGGIVYAKWPSCSLVVLNGVLRSPHPCTAMITFHTSEVYVNVWLERKLTQL